MMIIMMVGKAIAIRINLTNRFIDGYIISYVSLSLVNLRSRSVQIGLVIEELTPRPDIGSRS